MLLNPGFLYYRYAFVVELRLLLPSNKKGVECLSVCANEPVFYLHHY